MPSLGAEPVTRAPKRPRGRVAPGTHPTELGRLAIQELHQPDVDLLRVQALLWLFRAYGATQAAFSSELRPTGLSTSAFNVLMVLLNTPERILEPCDLADRLLISRPSITGLIDTLQRKGMVERRPFPGDRRRVLVALTQSAVELLTEHYPTDYATERGPFGDLDDDELGTLVALLRRVRGAAPRQLDGPPDTDGAAGSVPTAAP